jgi:hypothetical protein
MALPKPVDLEPWQESIMELMASGVAVTGVSVSFGGAPSIEVSEIKLKDYYKMHNHKKECVYCEGELIEVRGNQIWPARADLAKNRFMICWQCSAWVGMTDDGIAKGYAAKKHIRELREMVLTSWHHVCNTGAMPFHKADEFRSWLQENHGFDTSDLGWLEEEELRTLLSILDKILIPDTPEVDALFK